MTTAPQDIITTKEAQKWLLYLFDKIIDVCQSSDITYYACGGTLLGAVRHGGFIPWDDDIDIMIFRKDYETFVNACTKYLDSPITIRTRESDKYYCQEFIKICFEDDLSKFSELALDVFIMDEVDPRKKLRILLQDRSLKLLYHVKMYKTAKDGMAKPYCPRGIAKRIILGLLSCFSYHTIDTIHKRIMTACKNGSCVTCWGSCYPRNKEIYKKEWLSPPRALVFEGKSVLTPREPEKILAQLYGEDYMSPPPKNERKTHGVHVFFNNSISLVEVERELSEKGYRI